MRTPLVAVLAVMLVAMPASSGGNRQSNRRLTIHEHARGGDHEYVGRLIRLGQNPDRPSSTHEGRTPLHLGAEWGHLEVVKVLLAAKVTVDPLDDSGWTPLHLAAWDGKAEVVQALLDAGASKGAVGYRGETALHLAAENGSYKATKCLLPFRAVALGVNELGWTPLHKAAAFGHRDCLEVLVARKDELDRQTLCGFTAMHLAARRDDTELIDVLLKAGANPALRDQLGRTPAELYSEWRGRRARQPRDEVAGVESPAPIPEALRRPTEELPYLFAHYRGGGYAVDGKDHSALDVALWTDGVILFCSNPEKVGVDVRAGLVSRERVDFLWRELQGNGILELEYGISAPDCGSRRIDHRGGSRWRGVCYDRSVGSPRKGLRDGCFIHSFSMAGMAIESIIPSESWPVEELLEEGLYRGFDPEKQGASLRSWTNRGRKR